MSRQPIAATSRVIAGIRWLWIAAFVGCGHAGFSLYWTTGGTWLLDTVGSWAVAAAADGGPLIRGGLLAIGMSKLVAALTPVLVERTAHPRLRRWVRGISWIGALGLTAYGGANTIVATLVLNGVISTEDDQDHQALLGHALLWDPMFLAWGLSLLAGLVLTRSTRKGRD